MSIDGHQNPDFICLRAGDASYNGQYVCAEGGGGHEVVANRNEIGPWESFQVVEAPSWVLSDGPAWGR